ncbi:MAG: GTP-binding protein [Candidatus Micrarchaeota archaeon]
MRIPITIITGYLGAGKTTLLRRIAEGAGMKIAILMNEFGDIAIDSKVVEGKNIKMAELSGGCVCCSLSGEFEAAVAEILERVAPEWIIVETTGVAEPAALAYDVVENMAGVRLDAIITVVDADSMVRFPSLGHTGREQIELADMLVLNKTDLVSGEALESLRGRLGELNSRASLIEAVQCEIDLKAIFGIERSRAERPHKTHSVDYDYFDFTGGRLDYASFMEWVGSLPGSVYRSKGFVVTEKGSFLFNYVAGRCTIDEFKAARTELVFIGKNIEAHREELLAGLKKCVVD